MHEFFELFWVILTKFLNLYLLFLLFNVSIFLSFWSTWKTLPRKWSSQEIEDDMTNCFQVISSRLLIPDMSINTGISGCTCEILTISEWNMLSVRTLVTFGKTKINNIDCILGLFSSTNKEVIRLDVSMNDPFFMNSFDSLN